jgi:transposase-like protein
MVALSCPHCHGSKNVINYGSNRSGTARCLCHDCKKTFTLLPKNRALSPENEAAIERALAERISQQGIARMFKVRRDTVRRVRQKGHSACNHACMTYRGAARTGAGACPKGRRNRNRRVVRATDAFIVAVDGCLTQSQTSARFRLWSTGPCHAFAVLVGCAR